MNKNTIKRAYDVLASDLEQVLERRHPLFHWHVWRSEEMISAGKILDVMEVSARLRLKVKTDGRWSKLTLRDKEFITTLSVARSLHDTAEYIRDSLAGALGIELLCLCGEETEQD